MSNSVPRITTADFHPVRKTWWQLIKENLIIKFSFIKRPIARYLNGKRSKLK